MTECIIGIFIFFLCTNSIKAAGLYNLSDQVTILNGDSLAPTLHNSSSLFLIEYYNEWCGHCQEYAPIYKALARDIADWTPLIRLGVVNCAEEFNRPCCSKQKINAVPTLRMYHPYANASDGGKSFTVGTVKETRQNIVTYIEKNIALLDWNYDTPKPTLLPANSQYVLHNMLPENMPDDVLYIALVFENSYSMIGKEVILDMSSCSNIIVRRVLADTADGNGLIKKLNIKDTAPFLIVISKNGTIFPIAVVMKTRYFYVYQLQRLPNVGIDKARSVIMHTPGNFTNDQDSQPIDYRDVKRDRVYLADIESGIRYMLSMEASATKVLYGKKLETLKKLINIFSQVGNYLPGRATTVQFMQNLNEWIENRTSIAVAEWLQKIEEKEIDSYLPSTKKRWVGCQPSLPSLRGYPCSLWTVFHVLSVAAYRAKLDKQLLPDCMYQYITNFFGCRECRNNFKNEVKEMPFKQTDSEHDAILWLWKVHNKVNKRLHTNSTREDPAFPKLQFPSQSLCEQCWNSATKSWNVNEVAHFLIRFYSSEHVSTDFLLEAVDLEIKEKESAVEIKSEDDIWSERLRKTAIKQDVDDDYVQRFHPRGLGYNRRRHSGQNLFSHSIGFSSIDYSLCLLLWFTSCTLVGVLCIAAHAKRGWFRKLKLSKHVL